MNGKTIFALTLAATLASGVTAHAQPASSSNVPAQPGSAGRSPGGYGAPEGGGRGFGRAITLADYQARFRDRILQADTDHDGRVSLAEWTAYRTERSGGGEGGEGRRGGAGFGDPTRQFQMMDANHDGYVTAAEIDAASAERFARMDANHDGVLTPDERPAMRGGQGDRGTGGESGQSPPPPQ